MFKDIQITLYDLFGYLLPGAIVSFAIGIAFWALFWPSLPLVVPAQLSTLEIVFCLFTFYLVGHLGQAIGNLLVKLPNIRTWREQNISLSPGIRTLFLDAVSTCFGHAATSLSVDELFLLCDQTLIHNSSLGEREIFVYREGFYRGTYIALSCMSVSTIL